MTDRLTVLSLKILIGTERGKPVTHFQTEQTALLQMLRSRTVNGAWLEQVLELAAVNGQLWQAEDQLRAFRQADQLVGSDVDPIAVKQWAFRIQALNDRRAALVAEINARSGDGEAPEKL